MRKILLFVWACMGLVCLMSACKTSVKSKEWKLVWVENFDQKNSFDESVWTKIPRGTSDWNNYMSYYDSCYAMQDGNLILRGIANHTQKNDTAPYLTGGVYTKGKKLFTGGRVERELPFLVRINARISIGMTMIDSKHQAIRINIYRIDIVFLRIYLIDASVRRIILYT